MSYDAPRTLASYLHRVGRTARAGKKGTACTFMEESDRKLIKAVSKRGSKLVARAVPQHVVEEFHAKVEGMSEQIKEVEYEERAEKHLQRAEMEATKAENLVEHARDIHARPAKTWFQSEREKKAQSKASLKASEREDVDELEDVALGNGAGKKGKKTRRAEREAAERVKLPDSKRAETRARRVEDSREGAQVDGRGRRRAGRADDGQTRREDHQRGQVGQAIGTRGSLDRWHRDEDPEDVPQGGWQGSEEEQGADVRGDSDDEGLVQRHGRGADYQGKQRGNFANGRGLAPEMKKSKGSGFKSKAKYKRKR